MFFCIVVAIKKRRQKARTVAVVHNLIYEESRPTTKYECVEQQPPLSSAFSTKQPDGLEDGMRTMRFQTYEQNTGPIAANGSSTDHWSQDVYDIQDGPSLHTHRAQTSWNSDVMSISAAPQQQVTSLVARRWTSASSSFSVYDVNGLRSPVTTPWNQSNYEVDRQQQYETVEESSS